MSGDNAYDTLTSRNRGYITDSTQKAISETTVLVAGCGMGSAPAICLARTGFRKFILVDGDVVDAHNLNRQFYVHADIGVSKVEALRRHILAINPDAEVEAIAENLDAANTAGIVARCDIVFDTVDFVDLAAVIGLHSAARDADKPLMTAINVGFGALVWFIAPDSTHPLPTLIAEDMERLRARGGDPSVYGDVYMEFVGRLMGHLDGEVLEVLGSVLADLKAGKACPTPQLAVGSFTVSALAATMMHDYLAGYEVVKSPSLVIQSWRSMRTSIVTL